MAFYQGLPFNEGEEKMHTLTKVPHRDNPMNPGLTPRAAQQISMYPLMALGTTDPNDDNRPWTTLWGGEPPMSSAIAPGGIIGIKTKVDASFDPVVNILLGKNYDGEIVKRTENDGPMVSGLSISLEQRSRVKLYGKMVAGTVDVKEADRTAIEGSENQGFGGDVQLVLKIEQSLGNCPKYLNKKVITPYADLKPHLASEDIVLSKEARDLVQRADMFFISSSHRLEDMDTNHRGGAPGFIRTQQPDSSTTEQGTVLVWPEYSGNNLYQTLGNLTSTPQAGLAIPDFETGSILYLSGNTEILINEAASNIIAKSRLAVRFTTTRSRLVRNGLGFRGQPINDASLGRSPYNPRIRYLTTEQPDEFSKSSPVTASLIKKTKLSPSTTKYRFSLSDPKSYGPWQPGQYVAFDFSSELDMGYKHMSDDDPTSLNDDYIRTFTVSSPPDSLGIHGEEFEVVVRTKGSVTNWLSRQREGHVEAGVLGFGGSFRFENTDIEDEQERKSRKGVFIAAGVGITPLLGQRGVVRNLKVRWSASVRDVGLVLDVLDSCSDVIKKGMVVYLTGNDGNLDENIRRSFEQLMSSGVKVERRRMLKEDLTALEAQTDDWYLCTAPDFRQRVQSWLPGKTIVFENFDY